MLRGRPSLIFPGKHTGGPERARAWLKVTQQLVLGADPLGLGAWAPPPSVKEEGDHLSGEFNNE